MIVKLDTDDWYPFYYINANDPEAWGIKVDIPKEKIEEYQSLVSKLSEFNEYFYNLKEIK